MGNTKDNPVLLNDLTYDKIWIKRTEAARFFNISSSQFVKWLSQDANLKKVRSFCNLKDVYEFHLANKSGVDNLDVNNGNKDATMAELKRQIQKEILKNKRIENHEMEKKLVSKEFVVKQDVEKASDLKYGLENLKTRLSLKCANRSEQEIAKIIEQEVGALLTNFQQKRRFK